MTTKERLVGMGLRPPLVVLAPTHREAVRWAESNGFSPSDERAGRLVLIDYGGGDRLRGCKGGTFVVVGGLNPSEAYWLWLQHMKEMLELICDFVELGNWDDALDGATREVLYWAHVTRLQGDWRFFDRTGP